ncbi:hypothetical protein BV898_02989 [Hypsibius exemplaris]|uniref:F-box domain-containing protein n=1 Tax=Hypsibius exemplaris TaxID=2072580 RepID=A0A1W0X6E1_HYPEX|nr:hypothetical protein BV898_02989 [Hypsibius exemplaris]
MTSSEEGIGVIAGNGNFLSDLPLDILHKLLTEYVGAEGIASLEGAGPSMVAFCRDDALWRKLCCLELGLMGKELGGPCKRSRVISDETDADHLIEGSPMSFYTLFTELIYPCRGLFGRLLCSSATCYGDVITMTYDNGAIYGEVWFPPAKVTDTMKSLLDFVIYVDESTEEFEIFYEHSPTTKSTVLYPKLRNNIIRGSGLKEGSLKAVLAFIRRDFNQPYIQKVLDFIRRVGPSCPRPRNLFNVRLFPHSLRQWFFTDWIQPSNFPSPRQIYDRVIRSTAAGSCVLDGFFKGTYGAHGTELILMRIEEVSGKPHIVGLKIKGDPNVPAGVNSFQFGLHSNIRLNSTQQNDIAYLESLQHGPQWLSQDHQPQPFSLPDAATFLLRVDPEAPLPTSCIGRMVGSATIAEDGYRNPQSIVAHLVIFSPEKFLIMFLGPLDVASVFEKVSDMDRFTSFYR